MTTEKLYPVDYDQSKDPEPEKSAAGRDTVAALALIRAAVPKGGAALTPADLVALVCGRYVRATDGSFLPMAGAPDASIDLAAALVALGSGAPLRGPAAFSSLTEQEVRELVQTVIEERRPTWKLTEAVAVAAVEEVIE